MTMAYWIGSGFDQSFSLLLTSFGFWRCYRRFHSGGLFKQISNAGCLCFILCGLNFIVRLCFFESRRKILFKPRQRIVTDTMWRILCQWLNVQIIPTHLRLEAGVRERAKVTGERRTSRRAISKFECNSWDIFRKNVLLQRYACIGNWRAGSRGRVRLRKGQTSIGGFPVFGLGDLTKLGNDEA